MTESQKLIDDIRTLKGAIQQAWVDWGSKHFSLRLGERLAVRQEIVSCTEDLRQLLGRLEAR